LNTSKKFLAEFQEEGGEDSCREIERGVAKRQGHKLMSIGIQKGRGTRDIR